MQVCAAGRERSDTQRRSFLGTQMFAVGGRVPRRGAGRPPALDSFSCAAIDCSANVKGKKPQGFPVDSHDPQRTYWGASDSYLHLIFLEDNRTCGLMAKVLVRRGFGKDSGEDSGRDSGRVQERFRKRFRRGSRGSLLSINFLLLTTTPVQVAGLRQHDYEPFLAEPQGQNQEAPPSWRF